MFDELLLLSRGKVIFQGPATECCAYFSRLGYECPPHFNPADFLLDLLTVGADEEDQTEGLDSAGGGGAAAVSESSSPPSRSGQSQSQSAQGSSPGAGHASSNLLRRIRSRDGGSHHSASLSGEGPSAAHILVPTKGTEGGGQTGLLSSVEGASLAFSRKDGAETYGGELMRVSVPLEAIQSLPAYYADSEFCRVVKERVEEELCRDSAVRGGQRNLHQMLKSHSLFWQVSVFCPSARCPLSLPLCLSRSK